jgi:hypothetical protein
LFKAFVMRCCSLQVFLNEVLPARCSHGVYFSKMLLGNFSTMDVGMQEKSSFVSSLSELSIDIK